MLAISEPTLANYERRGILHPQYDYRRDRHGIDRRVVVYDPSEIAKIRSFRPYHRDPVAQRTSGEVEARACELFREAKSDEEVVVELRETFDRVDDLRQKWSSSGGGRCVIDPEAWKALEGLVGRFDSVPELVEKLVKRLKVTTPMAGSIAEVRDAETSRAQSESPARASAGLAVERTRAGSSTAVMSAPCAQSTEASVNDGSADRAAVRTEPGSDKSGRVHADASDSRDIDRPTGKPAAAPPESREWPDDLVSAAAEPEAEDGSAAGSGPERAAGGAVAATGTTASGLCAAQSPRELLLDELLHSLGADDARLQQLGELLAPAEKVVIAELASTMGIAVAMPAGSRSLREQILDAFLASITTDQGRLEQIKAVLNANERDVLAELRVHNPSPLPAS